jgi:CrcB protein
MIAQFAVVAAGGALGAAARYGVALLVARFWRRDFPLATFVINVSGSFAIAFCAGNLFLATGFIGAFTTFSTFEYETQRLVETGAAGWGLVNVVASVLAGFLAVHVA